MIFKTFNNDIDKMSAKWGIFGRSFNDFIEASNKRKIVIDDLFTINGVSLQDAKKQAGSFWSYLYPKKEDIKSQLIDVDALYPKIDKDNFDFDGWISKLNEVDKKVKANEISWQDYSNKLEENQKWIAKWGAETQGSIRSQEDLVQANQKAREAAIAQNNALKQQTLGAKAAAVGMQMLATVGNMIAFALITKGIELAVKGIDALIVTDVELNQKIKETESNWKELANNIQSSAKKFQDLKTQADDIIPKYAKLAQGVDKYGNNISLSEEEFKEFVSLNNQLGQMFPELVSGYDLNGNAILALSGNIDTLTESLYACVEAQRLSAAQEIADTMPEIVEGDNGIIKSVGLYEEQIKRKQDALDAWNQFVEHHRDSLYKNGTKIEDRFIPEDVIALAESLGVRREQITNLIEEVEDGYASSHYNYDKVFNSKVIENAVTGYEKQIEDLNNRIEAKWQQLNPVVSAWLSNDFLYQDIVKDDKDMQNIISRLISGVDFKDLGLKKSEDIQNYISDNIISPIYDMDSETKKAFSEIFDLQETLDNGKLSIDKYQNKINSILENGNFSKEFVTIFKLAFGEEDFQKKYNDAIKNFEKDDQAILENFFSKNSINTSKEIDYWNKITKGAKTATEAIEMYNEKSDIPDSTSILPKSSLISQLTDLSDGFAVLDKIYADVKNGAEFDFTNLDTKKFAENFKGLEKEYTAFIETVSSSPNDIEGAQSAFNDLITAWINSKGFLNQLDESTRQVTIDMLSNYGIENAADIVSEKLKDVAAAKQFLAETGSDVTNATSSQVLGFLQLAGVAQDVKQRIAALYLQNLNFANMDFTTEGIQDQILQIASSCDITGDKASKLAVILQDLAELQVGLNDADSQVEIAGFTGMIAGIQAQADSLIKGETLSLDLKYSGGKETKQDETNTKEKTSEIENTDYKKLLDDELNLLEKQLDAELISFTSYINKRKDMIQDYYDNGKISASEYYDSLNKHYENELSYMDKVKSTVISVIDDEIGKYQDQIEVLEEVHESKMTALDEEIKKYEEQKEKLQEDNDEIERQLALEQALYEQERAKSQRTNKVYIEGRGYVYQQDEDAVRDANEEVRKAKLDNQIAEIDDAIEKLQEQQETLEENLDKEKESLDRNIEDLEEYKEKWNDATEKYEEDQNRMITSAVFGKDWENQVLQDRITNLTKFTEEYETLQKRQFEAAYNASLAAVNDVQSGSGSGSGASGTGVQQYSGNPPSEKEKEVLIFLRDVTKQKVNLNENFKSQLNQDALKSVQKAIGVTETGKYDEATYKRLKQVEQYGYDSRIRMGIPIYWNFTSRDIPKYAKGGVIPSYNSYSSDYLAKQLGEEHIIAAKEGERVLTPAQNEMWERWTANLPELLSSLPQPTPDILQPDYANLSNLSTNSTQNISLSIGDILLQNVQDTDTLATAIIRELPGKVLQAMHKR